MKKYLILLTLITVWPTICGDEITCKAAEGDGFELVDSKTLEKYYICTTDKLMAIISPKGWLFCSLKGFLKACYDNRQTSPVTAFTKSTATIGWLTTSSSPIATDLSDTSESPVTSVSTNLSDAPNSTRSSTSSKVSIASESKNAAEFSSTIELSSSTSESQATSSIISELSSAVPCTCTTATTIDLPSTTMSPRTSTSMNTRKPKTTTGSSSITESPTTATLLSSNGSQITSETDFWIRYAEALKRYHNEQKELQLIRNQTVSSEDLPYQSVMRNQSGGRY